MQNHRIIGTSEHVKNVLFVYSLVHVSHSNK